MIADNDDCKGQGMDSLNSLKSRFLSSTAGLRFRPNVEIERGHCSLFMHLSPFSLSSSGHILDSTIFQLLFNAASLSANTLVPDGEVSCIEFQLPPAPPSCFSTAVAVADVVQSDLCQIFVTARLYGDLDFEIAYAVGKFQIYEPPHSQDMLNSDQASPEGLTSAFDIIRPLNS
jgi:hypothetical protein